MRKILLGLIWLLFAVPAVAATLPAGYTELEYIESTGTQYIDNIIKTNKNYSFEITYKHTASSGYQPLFVVYDGSNGYSYGFMEGSTERGNYAYSGGSKTFTLSYDTSTIYTTYYDGINKKVYRNGTEIVDFSETTGFSGTTGVAPRLFQIRTGEHYSGSFNYSFKGYAYSFKTYDDNNNLVRNLVPAKRDSDGAVGMYDLVTETFFPSSSSAAFIAGPEIPQIRIATTAYNAARFSPVVTELNNTIATIRDVVTNTINQTKAIADLQATKQTRPNENCPAGKKCLLVEDDDGQPHWYEIIEKYSRLPDGFTELEYIEAQTNTIIRTDVTGFNNNDVEIYIKWMQTKNPTKNYHCIGQVYQSEDHNTYRLIGQLQSSPNAYFANGNTRAGSGGIQYNLSQNTIHTTILSNHSVTMDGVTQSNPSPNATTIPASSTFNMMSEGMRLYSAYVKTGGDFKGDFVPAKRNSDGQLGIYNTITDSFLFEDTGTFTAGPEI